MRIWHLLVIVCCLACVFGIARTEIGRVVLIMFFTGLGEFILGTTAVMHLFKTIGAFGEAKTVLAHVEAAAATALVLAAATALMNGVLWVGSSLLELALT